MKGSGTKSRFSSSTIRLKKSYACGSISNSLSNESPSNGLEHESPISTSLIVIAYLRKRNLLDKVLDSQEEKGDEFVLSSNSKILHPNKPRHFAEQRKPESHDLEACFQV
ncbi:MAG: hypothetical protein R3C28_11210 [Pirellulaceae bacterium]